jgi:hypothetical protein
VTAGRHFFHRLVLCLKKPVPAANQTDRQDMKTKSSHGMKLAFNP